MARRYRANKNNVSNEADRDFKKEGDVEGDGGGLKQGGLIAIKGDDEQGLVW